MWVCLGRVGGIPHIVHRHVVQLACQVCLYLFRYRHAEVASAASNLAVS